jgi:hypothetical protein
MATEMEGFVINYLRFALLATDYLVPGKLRLGTKVTGFIVAFSELLYEGSSSSL